jgi:uncharacterized protein YjbJ (UPF0337 family)
MHHQISEYPLDYTKTEIPQAKAATGDLADRLDRARGKTDEAASKVTDQVSELTEEAKNAFDRLLPSVEKSLKERPLATLALISIAAFALGALVKK